MTKNSSSGFTLIELLVTVIIMAILGLLITQTLISTIRVSSKTEVMKEVKQTGDLALNMITRKIQSARSIDCHTVNYTLSMENQDHSTSAFTAVADNGICRIQESDTPFSGPPVVNSYLTPISVSLTTADNIDKCSISINYLPCLQVAGQDARVTIVYTLYQATTPTSPMNFEDASIEYNTTVSLRNINF